MDTNTKDAQVTPQVNSEIVIKPTGIAELDTMLNGGLPSGAAVLLAGASGTGKTVLAMQWLFEGFEKYKEPGIYISLTEPVVKAVKNASTMSFFKKERVNPLEVHFTDLRGVIKGLGLEGKEFNRDDIEQLVETIRNMAVESGAKRIVLDSITAIGYRLQNKDLIREFVFRLGTMLAQLDANVIMTSEVTNDNYSVFGVEEFVSDGIIKLVQKEIAHGGRAHQLEIRKMRSRSFDAYPAIFRITSDGVKLFPRVSGALKYSVSNKRVSSGINGLDEMLGGGYFEGSTTILSGASGTGKTNIAVQNVIKAVERGEKVVYVTFEESHDHLLKVASAFGWDLGKYEQSGLLKILAWYPEEKYLDEHMSVIMGVVKETGAKHLVVDSLSALDNAFSKEMVRDFSTRIMATMKEQKVTTLFTIASAALMGTESVTGLDLSTISDNIIMLRYVEINSELRHGLLILKVRGSAHDKRLRGMIFTSTGIEISTTFAGYEGVIGGSARKVNKSMEDQAHDLFLEILGPMGEKIFNEEKAKGLTANNIAKLVADLGNQGIISERRKEEFVSKAEKIFSEK